MPLHIDTPLLETAPGYSACGKPLLLKMDALQPGGSFKMRGIGRLCEAEVAAGARAIYCASGGNAGLAATFAGRALNVPVTIVVPDFVPVEMHQRLQAAGASVLVHGSAFDETDRFARAEAEAHGAAYIHPFDHPLLWEGHATMIDEVVKAGAGFDCVIASVGGGGLMAGIIEGLARNGLGHVPFIAAETDGANALAASLAAGERVTLPAITSIATSLGASRVAEKAFELALSHPVTSLTVTDADTVAALIKFADAYRVLVEPACGAALAIADVHAHHLAPFSNPLIIICGGIGVSLAKIREWQARF